MQAVFLDTMLLIFLQSDKCEKHKIFGKWDVMLLLNIALWILRKLCGRQFEHDNSEYVNNFTIGQLLGVQSPEKQRLLYNTACQKVLNASIANRKLSISMV